MKKPILLKTVTHNFIPSAVVTVKELPGGDKLFNTHTPNLTTDVDFEKGTLRIEGDWHFMMTCNKHAEPEWLTYHTDKVFIEASILPSSVIDLSDENSDGSVFILEGKIKDNNSNCSNCAGLLVLDKMNAGLWHICFYLYDSNREECEIAFKIPAYVSRSNLILN